MSNRERRKYSGAEKVKIPRFYLLEHKPLHTQQIAALPWSVVQRIEHPVGPEAEFVPLNLSYISRLCIHLFQATGPVRTFDDHRSADPVPVVAQVFSWTCRGGGPDSPRDHRRATYRIRSCGDSRECACSFVPSLRGELRHVDLLITNRVWSGVVIRIFPQAS